LGFKFKLIVVVEGKSVVLPDEWLSWNQVKIQSYVNAACLGTIKILSMDPGTANFAWSVIEVCKPFKPTVLASGMIEYPVKSMSDGIMPSLDMFRAEVSEIMDEFEISHVAMERYMTRGLKGATIELVNVMIGAVLSIGYLDFKIKDAWVIPAAQWKNEFNRRGCLEEFYKTVECVVHQVDAVMIGLYSAYHWYDITPFSVSIKTLSKQINQTNTKIIQTR
jgi:hypothetical protein